MKTFCVKCNRSTNHSILYAVEDSEGDPVDYFTETTHQIIKCDGCDYISFRRSIMDKYSFDEDGYEAPYEVLYPLGGPGMIQPQNYFNIPGKIRIIYREMIQAYNNGLLILCSAGLRSTIEGICNLEGIKDGPVTSITTDGSTVVKREKDLQGKINGLHEKGLLTPKHAEILHKHHFLGNDALHELAPLSKDELKLAIEIIEHTIDNIYELAEKAEKLQEKKQKRIKKP